MDLVLVSVTHTALEGEGGGEEGGEVLSVEKCTHPSILPTSAHPTLIPSSTSVGAKFLCKLTTNLANCFTLMMYFGSSVSALMILVQRATCNTQTHRHTDTHTDTHMRVCLRDSSKKRLTYSALMSCVTCLEGYQVSGILILPGEPLANG